MKNTIFPCIWCDNNASEMAKYHVSVFGDGSILNDNGMVTNSLLSGVKFMYLNGGPQFEKNPAISFFVRCQSIEEVDQYSHELIKEGTALMELGEYPWAQKYAWINDKYGVSWQIIFQEGHDATQKFQPSLLFTNEQLGNAQKAIKLYTEVFPNSEIIATAPYPEQDAQHAGMIMYSSSNINGMQLVAMDGPGSHHFGFNESVSLVVNCKDQAEIDLYWNSLMANGGKEGMCGWLKDPYGVSWQIIPENLGALLAKNGPTHMMSMKKIVIDEL